AHASMIRVNDSQWPVVRIDFLGNISFQDVEKLSKELRKVQLTRGAFVVLSDLTNLRAASATARLRQAIAEVADEFSGQGALLAEAVIVPNPILRALFTGYTWLRRNTQHDQKTFADFESALSWAQE